MLARRGPGAYKTSAEWREFERLSFDHVPVLSQREVCKRMNISRMTGRGMWYALAAERRRRHATAA